MRFEALKEQLLKGGIAPRRVRRYLAELDDHLAALTEQERAAGYDAKDAAIRARALLGSDSELAQTWLANPRLKSLAARAPWLVFGVLPPIAAIFTLLPPTLLLVAIGKAYRLMQPHQVTPEWFQHLAAIMVQTGNLILVPSIALVLASIAWRQRLAWFWPFLTAALLLFLSVRMGYQPGTLTHRGSISVGMAPFMLPGARASLLAEWPWAVAQWLLILLPATLFDICRRSQIKIG